MQKVVKCSATNVELSNKRGSVIFLCPKCGEGEIARSYHARELGVKYQCSRCEFEGPN